MSSWFYVLGVRDAISNLGLTKIALRLTGPVLGRLAEGVAPIGYKVRSQLGETTATMAPEAKAHLRSLLQERRIAQQSQRALDTTRDALRGDLQTKVKAFEGTLPDIAPEARKIHAAPAASGTADTEIARIPGATQAVRFNPNVPPVSTSTPAGTTAVPTATPALAQAVPPAPGRLSRAAPYLAAAGAFPLGAAAAGALLPSSKENA